MRCRGWQQLKENQNKGVSLAIVLCVSAFFVAFAAAILYTAGVLTSASTERLSEERVYQLAKSYSEVLDKELKKYENKGLEGSSGSFYEFANYFLDGNQYKEYDPQNPESTRYRFLAEGSHVKEDLSRNDSLGDAYGNLCVTLYKEHNADESTNPTGGTIALSSGDYSSQIANIENTVVRQYILTMDVTAYYEELTYTYRIEYTREVKYSVQFTHNGTTIVWSDGRWKVGNTSGADYTFPEGTTEPIRYTYLTNNTSSCRFVENTYAEEGGTTDGN